MDNSQGDMGRACVTLSISFSQVSSACIEQLQRYFQNNLMPIILEISILQVLGLLKLLGLTCPNDAGDVGSIIDKYVTICCLLFFRQRIFKN